MEENINNSKKRLIGTVEIIFWLVVIFLSIFMDFSPGHFRATKPVFLAIMLFAFLVIILVRASVLILSPKIKAIFRLGVLLFALLPFLLMLIGAGNIVKSYYLPIALSLAMACLIVIIPRVYVIMFIAVCIFFLSGTFSGAYIGSDAKLKFPIEASRTLSLILVVIFSYYLYRKEMSISHELKGLNDKLRHFDEMKSIFVANLSHELRTPLTSIRNAVVLLNKKMNNEGEAVTISEKELLDIIMSNVDRQTRLINSLLNLAKIESGKLKEPRSLTQIDKIAQDVVKSLSMQAEAKGISIITEIEPGLPAVYASQDQIAEVYTNLLDNAIKYTKPGGRVNLKISASSAEIRSVIEDNGPGIAPENISKLFDKFKRLEEIVEHRNKGVGVGIGVGLGLVIVKEIIESHGGKIWVKSKPGESTEFIFTLPQGLRENDS